MSPRTLTKEQQARRAAIQKAQRRWGSAGLAEYRAPRPSGERCRVGWLDQGIFRPAGYGESFELAFAQADRCARALREEPPCDG